jgi:hypothetical protein
MTKAKKSNADKDLPTTARESAESSSPATAGGAPTPAATPRPVKLQRPAKTPGFPIARSKATSTALHSSKTGKASSLRVR